MAVELTYIGDVDVPVVGGQSGLEVDAGDDVAIIVNNNTGDRFIKTIDISDESAPSVLSTASFSGDRDEVSGTAIDTTNKIMVVGGRNTMSLMVIDYSDPNNISFWKYETADEFELPDIWPEQEAIFVTNKTDDQFKIYDYSDPSNLSVLSTPSATSIPEGCGFMKQLEIVYVGDQGSNTADSEVVYDVSDPANPSTLWTGNVLKGFSPLDIAADEESGRPYFYVVEGSNLKVLKWDDANSSLSRVVDKSLDVPSGVDYVESKQRLIVGSDSTSPSAYIFDMSDPESPVEEDTAYSGDGDWSDEGGPDMGGVAEGTEHFYSSGGRVIYADGTGYVAILSTNIASILLAWGEQCGRNESYRIQRRNVTQGTAFSDIATPDASRPLEHEDEVSTLNEIFEYRIRAENDQGQSPWSNLAQVKPT